MLTMSKFEFGELVEVIFEMHPGAKLVLQTKMNLTTPHLKESSL